MLSRNGVKHPPHELKVPTLGNATPQPTLCSFCQTHLFNSGLHENLTTALDDGSDPDKWTCARRAREYRTSILQGCKFCVLLGQGVLTAAHLDYWYDRWNGSNSDSEFGYSISGEEQSDQLDIENDRSPSNSSLNANQDVDASTDAQFDPSEKVPSFLSLDMLDCDCTMDVKLLFQRADYEDPFLSKLEVVISVTNASESDSELPELTGDRAVSLTFQVFQDQNCNLFPSATDSVDLSSDKTFCIANEWMRQCRSHKICRDILDSKSTPSQNTDRRVPMRIIQLEDNQPPRLVDHASLDAAVPYAALSYVWGTKQTYILTRETMDSKYKELDTSSLPKTIVDALIVTRRLGLSHLWVDALCIIQDSDEDKAVNIGSMDQVYQHSEVTIIAGTAEAVTEGFLKRSMAPTYLVNPFTVSISLRNGKHCSFSLGYLQYYKPSEDPINGRAWTLQERVLSTRMLIYSYNGIKWACKMCEHDPASPPDATKEFPRITHTLEVAGQDLGDKDTIARSEWLLIRDDYTSRELSHDADKLRAIDGIAKVVANKTGWTYLKGLWKEFLFLDLHWHRDTTVNGGANGQLQPRPQTRVAPSFSWASMRGHSVDVESDFDPREAYHFQILDCTVGDSLAAGTGTMDDECLRVKGLTVDLGWRSATDGDITNGYLIDNQENQELMVGEVSLDALDTELKDGTRLCCIAMSVLHYENRIRNKWPVEGLALLPVDQRCYRRVGYFRIYSVSMFDDAEERICNIV